MIAAVLMPAGVVVMLQPMLWSNIITVALDHNMQTCTDPTCGLTSTTNGCGLSTFGLAVTYRPRGALICNTRSRVSVIGVMPDVRMQT